NIAVADGSINCTVSAFGGDPVPGTAKKCEYRGIAPPVTDNPVRRATGPLSCSPNVDTTQTKTPVIWTIDSAPAEATSFTWSGDELNTRATTGSLSIKYAVEGTKNMDLSALDAEQKTLETVSCGSVTVSNSTP